MSWQHGYHTGSPYTCGVYRELAPSWMDFAGLLQGHLPLRSKQGDSFAYLELGSGMGLGLCLLAATHPEGQFVGVDFKPDHIAHSRRLAGELALENIRFEEADFLTLAENPESIGDGYHYVVAHGIATWITASVQAALFSVAAKALLPGGLFYCSYNTLPGWLSAIPLQQLAWHLSETDLNAGDALQQAAALISGLLGNQAQPSALALSLPGLKERVEALPNQDKTYLCQEYINGGWQPLTFLQMQQRVSKHKLEYLASATLPDNFTGLLPTNIRSTISGEQNPLRREMLQDLAINQSFRRDLMAKGRLGTNAKELWLAFDAISLRLSEAPKLQDYRFQTSFGFITLDQQRCRSTEKALENGPKTFRELKQELKLDNAALIEVVSLLLHSQRIGLDRCEAGETCLAQVMTANQKLRELQLRGRPYIHLASAKTGSAVVMGHAETLLYNQTKPEKLGEALAEFGYQLNSKPQELSKNFAKRRPFLESLGVL